MLYVWKGVWAILRIWWVNHVDIQSYASCADLHRDKPALPSGLYTLAWVCSPSMLYTHPNVVVLVLGEQSSFGLRPRGVHESSPVTFGLNNCPFFCLSPPPDWDNHLSLSLSLTSVARLQGTNFAAVWAIYESLSNCFSSNPSVIFFAGRSAFVRSNVISKFFRLYTFVLKTRQLQQQYLLCIAL